MSGNQFFIICFLIAIVVVLLFTFAEHMLVNKEAFGEEILVDWNDGESLEIKDSTEKAVGLSFTDFSKNVFSYYFSPSG